MSPDIASSSRTIWSCAVPDRLVYLLDHEYTQRGLGWNALKNGDAARAEALRAAAAAARCGVALALAEVHESWQCVEMDWRGSSRSIVHSGAPDLDSEDRWYRRGAVILWPRDREFLIRAKASSAWGVGEVARCLRAGEPETATALARELAPVFKAGDEPKLFERTLDVAVWLADATVASRFLDRFTLGDLRPSHAKMLAALLETYGLEWCEARIASWSGSDTHWRRPVITQLTRLCEALYESELDDAVMLSAHLIERQWAVVRGAIDTAVRHQGPSRVRTALRESFAGLLDVLESRIFAFPKTNEDIDRFVAKVSWPPLILADFLDLVRRTHSPSVVEQLGIASLFERCRSALEAGIAAPERAEGDWAIHVDLGCTCELCCSLSGFLADPTRQEWLWPFAKDRRRHVHGALDANELPVTHETVRKGSPYKLELIKTRKLFSDERARRLAYAEALAALEAPSGKPIRRRRSR